MAATIYSAAAVGLDSIVVEVEADIGRSLPNVLVVGLPDTAVQESRERVRAAIKNSGLRFPTTRVTVNLAPGNVRKAGPSYDLPVALAILVASGELVWRGPVNEWLVVGELALDGALRSVAGVLSIALLARAEGFRGVIVPLANAREAALVDGLEVIGADSLVAVVRHLIGEDVISPTPPTPCDASPSSSPYDFAYIQGQAHVKRALEIAAAGGHNVLLFGPPGAGKTLLARSLVTVLPPMDKAEVLEVTRIYSSAGLLPGGQALTVERPFRAPHHTTSHVALVGGGTVPRPGEVSLAHRGVLFLDELPEFPRHVLEALRQPLEDGTVTIARAAGSLTFPARLTLVAAQNPCPCGFATDLERACTCTPSQLVAYRRRVSGPLLDRIDLHVPVPRLPTADLSGSPVAESSTAIRERVVAARTRQKERLRGLGIFTNAELSSAETRRLCDLPADAARLLVQAVDRLQLSARGYYRLLKVAQTIADLEGAAGLATAHVAEALQYRGQE